MSIALARLALLQFIVIVLTVILDGFALKARFGSGSHLPILATYVRDYGVVLLLIPTAWGIWGAIRSNRPVAGAGDAGDVFLTGIVVLGLLVVFGIISFGSAMLPGSLVISVPPSTASSSPVPR